MTDCPEFHYFNLAKITSIKNEPISTLIVFESPATPLSSSTQTALPNTSSPPSAPLTSSVTVVGIDGERQYPLSVVAQLEIYSETTSEQLHLPYTMAVIDKMFALNSHHHYFRSKPVEWDTDYQQIYELAHYCGARICMLNFYVTGLTAANYHFLINSKYRDELTEIILALTKWRQHLVKTGYLSPCDLPSSRAPSRSDPDSSQNNTTICQTSSTVTQSKITASQQRENTEELVGLIIDAARKVYPQDDWLQALAVRFVATTPVTSQYCYHNWSVPLLDKYDITHRPDFDACVDRSYELLPSYILWDTLDMYLYYVSVNTQDHSPLNPLSSAPSSSTSSSIPSPASAPSPVSSELLLPNPLSSSDIIEKKVAKLQCRRDTHRYLTIYRCTQVQPATLPQVIMIRPQDLGNSVLVGINDAKFRFEFSSTLDRDLFTTIRSPAALQLFLMNYWYGYTMALEPHSFEYTSHVGGSLECGPKPKRRCLVSTNPSHKWTRKEKVPSSPATLSSSIPTSSISNNFVTFGTSIPTASVSNNLVSTISTQNWDDPVISALEERLMGDVPKSGRLCYYCIYRGSRYIIVAVDGWLATLVTSTHFAKALITRKFDGVPAIVVNLADIQPITYDD